MRYKTGVLLLIILITTFILALSNEMEVKTTGRDCDNINGLYNFITYSPDDMETCRWISNSCLIPFYIWSVPATSNARISMASRFTPEGPETLKTVDFVIYDLVDRSIHVDVIVTIYDDDNDVPGTEILQLTVPYGSYDLFVNGGSFTVLDVSSHNLVFNNDFHIGISSTGIPGTSGVFMLSDGGSDDAANCPGPTDRTSVYYTDVGYWEQATDHFGGFWFNNLIGVTLCQVTGPAVSAIIPGNNLIDVLFDADISATFDSTMNVSTINTTTCIVNASQTGLHSGAITYDEITRTATFDPDENFAPGEIVTVTLTDGIESTGGIPLKSYSWSFTIEAITAPAEYDIIDYYDVSDSSHYVCPADLDNDGDLDLVAALYHTSNVAVLENLGNGIFADRVLYDIGDGQWSVCCADLNGDEYMDIAAANWRNNRVLIIFNNGDGTFGSYYSYAVGEIPRTILAADVDIDGDQDLIVSNNTGSDNIMILKNDGIGNFAIEGTYPVGDEPYFACTGDLDNDGDLDIVAANYVANTFTILFNNGDGTYGGATIIPTANQARSVIAVDFNHDQYLDLAVVIRGTGPTTDRIMIFLNTGDGTFVSADYYDTNDEPVSISAADLDGDGDMDLIPVHSSDGSISVFFNDGSGIFTYVENYIVGNRSQHAATGDFDNDGDMDIAIANWRSMDVTILFNEICTDTDGDHFGDPGYPANTCDEDNCPDHYNPWQEDYDLDGLGDSCDPCNNFMFTLEPPEDTILIQFLQEFTFFPTISDPDDETHIVLYQDMPHWCMADHDTLKGIAPDTAFVEPVTAVVMDECNIDTLSFITKVYLCGDASGDGLLNILDITKIISYLYKGGDPPVTLEAADADGSGNINILDITHLVSYLYKGGSPPVCQ